MESPAVSPIKLFRRISHYPYLFLPVHQTDLLYANCVIISHPVKFSMGCSISCRGIYYGKYQKYGTPTISSQNFLSQSRLFWKLSSSISRYKQVFKWNCQLLQKQIGNRISQVAGQFFMWKVR